MEQRAEEGTAGELIKEIWAEKEKLIKEGKIKKGRPLPPITEEEKPFDIPEGWEWVKLGEILFTLTDGTHQKPTYTNEGVPFLSVKDISNRKIDFSATKYISKREHADLKKRCFPEKGDILLSKVGTTGIPVIVNTDIEFSIFVSIALLKFSQCNLDNRFLLRLLESPLVQEQCAANTRGVGNKNWVLRDIGNTVVPIPPHSEQCRIVDKIAEIFPLIDQYEKAYTKLTNFNTRFPEVMKKSLLQYAIQGKLVEQRADEGTAKDLIKEIQAEKKRLIAEKKIKKTRALPPITEEEKPFDIPDEWEWVRLGDIGDWGSGATPKRHHQEYYGGNIPWLKTGDLNDGYISEIPEFITQEGFENSSVRLNPVGSVLMAMYGATIGKLGILTIPATTNQACCACMPFANLESKFLFYYLMSQRTNFIKLGEGGAQPNISKEKIVNFVFPLPPLAEQHRIVAKLEELLPCCEQLNKFAGKASVRYTL